MNNIQKHFFIADLHFLHKNILTLCNRRFSSIVEHDNHIIESINSVVGKNDILYILGDLGCNKDINNLRYFLKRIKCQIHVILGNHDHLADLVQLKREGVIADVKESKTVQINGQRIFLSHYPHVEWKGYFRGDWHLFGHVHNTREDNSYSTDVGVDAIGYTPWSFEQVKEYFETTDIVSKQTELDKKVNEFFPDLSAHYFVGLCTGNEEIRNKITEVLVNGGKSIGITK